MGLVDNIGELASLISALTIVGGALMWVYNKFIGEPREKKREKKALEQERKREQEARAIQELTIELITQKNEPLNQSIESLIEFTSESKEDREVLHRVTDEHTLRIGEHGEQIKGHTQELNEHNGRLIALETKNGITTYKFKEDK